MNHSSLSVKVGSGLIILNAIIWFAFAILVGAGAHPALPDDAVTRWVMTGLALLTAIAELVLLATLRKHHLAYYALIALLIFIAFLTITDEVGIPDVVVFVLTISPLGLLIRDRHSYV